MNINPSPQAVPGPAPFPAPDLGSCVQGIRQSILDWADSHPILGRLADPITVHILALLQTLADLFALFAAGQLAPSATSPRSATAQPGISPSLGAGEPASARVRNIARYPNCARRAVAPLVPSGLPRGPAGPRTPTLQAWRPLGRAIEPAAAGLSPSHRLRRRLRPSFFEKSFSTPSPTHVLFVPVSK